MDAADHHLLPANVAEWFPLVPRPRPPCGELRQRVAEVRALARLSSNGRTGLATAAEAHNKAALIASDCGLSDLARRLCWRQFDVFQAAAPLSATAAKFALQPIVNLGRLLTRARSRRPRLPGLPRRLPRRDHRLRRHNRRQECRLRLAS